MASSHVYEAWQPSGQDAFWMIEGGRFQPNPRKRLLIGVAGAMALAASSIVAQRVPDWQRTAGGKKSFEVASVKQDLSGKYATPPFSIDSDDEYVSTGGLFTADAALTTYISFAYKLDQQHSMLSHLPQWATTEHYEIRARAAGDPTKDEMRLMMQSLLADRFKLAVHFETQELPVLLLALAKPGELGPGLRLHADGPGCDVVAPRLANSTASSDMFPCNVYMAIDEPDHSILAGARNTTVELMEAFLTNIGHLRPVVDRTGISGKIDFSMKYTPEQRVPASTGADVQADLPGTTFLEAVKDQLGLKLVPARAPLQIPVVDHVERPSAN